MLQVSIRVQNLMSSYSKNDIIYIMLKDRYISY